MIQTTQQILDRMAKLPLATPEQVAAAEAKEQYEKSAWRIHHALSKTNCPKRHWQFDALSQNKWPKWRQTFDQISEILNGHGRSVALIGERSTGKTQMAVELLRRAFNSNRSCFFDTACGFYRSIKATYSRESEETELNVINRFREYDLLVLDEIGKTGATDWESAELFEMLNLRYGSMKDTLLTSNAGPEAFAEIIGPSLVRRLNETGGIIVCNW